MNKLIVLISCLVCSSFLLNAQIDAGFTLDGSTILCDGIEMNFTDQSTSDETITTWAWDFGNGINSTLQNPIIELPFDTTFTVCLTVTDAVNQIDTECQSFSFAAGALNVFASINNSMCHINNGGGGSIDLYVNGGIEPYLYNWSHLPGTDNPEDIFDIPLGTYSVTIVDANACTVEESFIVEGSTNPELILVLDGTCASASNNDGSVVTSVSGGVPPYHYSWSHATDSLTSYSNLSIGAYSVTVHDNNGCSVAGIYEIGTAIEQILGGDETYCEGTQAQLEVIAPNAVSYAWSAGDLSCYDCPNPLATVSLGSETSYFVTVTEADGCIDIGSIDFNVQSYLDFGLLEFSNSPVFPGADIVFDCNVSNAQTVTWSGPNGFTSMECNPVISADPGSDGTYTVDIVDQYGCQANASTDVYIYGIIESVSNDTIICPGEAVQLEVLASTAVSYSWTPAVALDNPTIANPIAMPSASTVYTVTVQDASGSTEEFSVSIEVEELPVIASSSPTSSCFGQSITLSADPTNLPGVYSWDGVITPTRFFTVFASDCYTFNYISPIGCPFEDQICVDVGLDVLDIESYSDTICRGNSVGLSIVVNDPNIASYEWSPSENLSCSDCSNPIATIVDSTVFSVIVTATSGCIDTAHYTVNVDQNCVWPGDTDTSFTVNNFDLLNIGLGYDSVGPTRPNASLNWIGQEAMDWWGFGVEQTAPNGTNLKHVDCDGNGVINMDDTLAIVQNWGEAHNFHGGSGSQFFAPGSTHTTPATIPFYVEPDTLIENETYELSIILGEEGTEAEDVYGIAFSLEYDPDIIVPGSALIGFNGWVGDLNADMIAIQKTFFVPGRIDVGVTRIDGMPMSGFGEIGQLYITIEDDILFHSGSGDSRAAEEVLFNITNELVINHLGEEIPVIPMETTSIVDEVNSNSEINWDEYIQVLPNPVSEILFVTTNNIEIESLKLFSIHGELIHQVIPNSSSTEINVNNFASGIYLLNVQTDLGVMVQRVVIGR